MEIASQEKVIFIYFSTELTDKVLVFLPNLGIHADPWRPWQLLFFIHCLNQSLIKPTIMIFLPAQENFKSKLAVEPFEFLTRQKHNGLFPSHQTHISVILNLPSSYVW